MSPLQKHFSQRDDEMEDVQISASWRLYPGEIVLYLVLLHLKRSSLVPKNNLSVMAISSWIVFEKEG
jgi:hypothetical protein